MAEGGTNPVDNQGFLGGRDRQTDGQTDSSGRKGLSEAVVIQLIITETQILCKNSLGDKFFFLLFAFQTHLNLFTIAEPL